LRILIDESLPVKFAAFLPDHEVSTVRQQRWHGLRNGVLLRTAVDRGFEIIISADQSIRYQQNLRAIGIAVIAIAGVRKTMDRLRPLVPKILAAIEIIKVGEVIEVRPR
jgi:predicted nuclease of predicted toxin-antitoxin system